METANHTAYPRRYVLITLILLLCIAVSYCLSMRLISQLYYLKSKDHLSQGYFGLASASLTEANHYNPTDYKIQKALGEVNFRLAGLKTAAEKSLPLTQKSKEYYLKALELNPLDAESAYGLARDEARLERLYQYLHPDAKNSPYKPLPYYNQAVRLRPNGISYQYALARYLFRQGKTEELSSAVRNLARIYPPTYYHLKKEKFWSPDVQAAVKQGLQKAIAQKISLRDAHSALASMLAEEQDWDGALAHYQKALTLRAFENRPGNYIRLGQIYLKIANFKQANVAFIQAIDRSRDRIKDMARIYSHYKREGRSDQFDLLFQQLSQRFALPLQVQILKARSLMDQQQYLPAKQILRDLNRQASYAESFYWLARIAEKEKDFDAMELAIQKATVLDPKNSQYHLLFSQVLKKLKKVERAEKEAGLALKHSTRPNPWLFNYRAWVRWSRQDYLGAVRDWHRATRLKPDQADFYAYIAEGYRKEGQKDLAQEYYQKALKLDPDNKKYQKKLLDLSSEGKGA